MRKKIIVSGLSILMAISTICSNSISIKAVEDTKSKYIGSYGYLTGTVSCFVDIDEKVCNSYAITTQKVPNIRSLVEVKYYLTGIDIAQNSSDWISDAKNAGTQDIEMHHFKNKLNNNRYDGFLNTELATYGTGDAITGDPYVVYTKVVY